MLIPFLLGFKVTLFKPLIDLNINCLQLWFGQMEPICYICKRICVLKIFTMVNSEKFSKRLQKIFNYYDLSAAAFADAINVGRSSISHILSGRNKPSLDFVLKIVQTYPEVELYWLLNGTGNFPGNLKVEDKPAAATTPIPPRTEINPEIRQVPSEQNPPIIASGGKSIQKIVIFYKDGTFEAFEN